MRKYQALKRSAKVVIDSRRVEEYKPT